MKRITDKVALGTLAGITSGAASLLLQTAFQRIGFVTNTWIQHSTGLTISQRYYKRTGSQSLGAATAISINIVIGIAQTYLYSLTGKDQLITKSIDTGLISWMTFQGLGTRILKSGDTGPKDSAVSLMSSLLGAYAASQLITKLGDENIFRKKQSIAGVGIDSDALSWGPNLANTTEETISTTV